jgi:transcriptional regulator with XRE-family HTH domain
MTQDEIAFKSGIPQPIISRFERGLQRPTDAQWKAIADALQVDVTDLTFYTYEELQAE